VLGWEHTFVHEVDHMLRAIRGEGGVAPHGATLEDGYRAAEVCDAILRSSRDGVRERIRYRTLAPVVTQAGGVDTPA
jgi:predicted dehydrogenase